MTIDEIIKHYEQVLKELKAYKEQSGDTISKQAVLEVQAKYAEYIGTTKFWRMRDDIKALPSVIPQPKMGRWIINQDSIGRKYGECSECTMRQSVGPLNYCPNCGAKMVELQESEDKIMTYGNGELPNGGWVPVLERLPDENGRYIVFMNTKVFSIRILQFAKNLNEISLDFKNKKAGWYDYDSEYGFFEWTGIEAWMPLPQPYKVEKENKK